MTQEKRASRQKVFTLLVEIGRKAGDGLPDGATGAALMCYASGVDEAEAVRETVAILKQADTAPLDVSGYGTLEERLAEGHDISDDERALMTRARDENAVIVAQVTPFFDDDRDRAEDDDETALTGPGDPKSSSGGQRTAFKTAGRSGGKPSGRGPAPAGTSAGQGANKSAGQGSGKGAGKVLGKGLGKSPGKGAGKSSGKPPRH